MVVTAEHLNGAIATRVGFKRFELPLDSVDNDDFVSFVNSITSIVEPEDIQPDGN